MKWLDYNFQLINQNITDDVQDTRFLSQSQDKLPDLLLNIFEGLNEFGT